MRANSGAKELVELRNRRAGSDVAVQELTAELKVVKSELVKVTTEKLESSTKLNAVEEESDKTLEELAVV